jgi:hypothetical protein
MNSASVNIEINSSGKPTTIQEGDAERELTFDPQWVYSFEQRTPLSDWLVLGNINLSYITPSRWLDPDEQRIMFRALRKSVRIVRRET